MLQELLLFLATISFSYGQSNYANQANDIEYVGQGLPDQATLDGKVTKLDDLSPVIFLNRTKAALNCAAGSMQVDLKFENPFYGVAYADFDRNSACQIVGKGALTYRLELPLKGCGTKQDPQRVFTNNIVVRFTRAFEIDGDETITIVCRYPPPVAPIPPAPPSFIQEELLPVSAIEPPLKGFQILLIICAILFLSLLLLGLGCSYYCLKRRRVAFIPHPFSSVGSGSEITKLSGSSLGNLDVFEGLKIPRAHAPVLALESSSGSSEGPLVSDTLPSDYPSESHSEIEDVDTRSLPVSSAGSFENKAFIQDNSSFCSEGYEQTVERSVQSLTASQAVAPPPPKFDVQVLVKSTPPAPASLSLSDTESSLSRTERNLSIILEQQEDSVRSASPEARQFTHIPELHAIPKHIQPAPTYTRILRRQQEMQWEEAPKIKPVKSMDTELIDESYKKSIAPPAPPPPPIIPKQQYVSDVETADYLDAAAAAPYQSEITSHLVDDIFYKTITEKRTIEDIEKHKRLITEYHSRPKPKEHQKWDVTIKNYPIANPEPPEWENFSDISSASGLSLASKPEKNIQYPPQSSIQDNKLPLNSPELVGNIGTQKITNIRSEDYLSYFELPQQNPEVANWDVLIRVLQPNEEETLDNLSEDSMEPQLSIIDKKKWRKIITTESTLRTLLSEAVVREDFERIRYDQRYESIFEPVKWDIILRILTPVDKTKGQIRFKKKNDWDSRSRRSSLPTLYEYDSDSSIAIKNLTNEPETLPIKSKRQSHYSFRSETDLRSLSEMTVEFGKPEQIESQSESSSLYHSQGKYYDDSDPIGYQSLSLVRSISQPSLARSASEFTERWVAPSRYETGSEFTSPEGTPKSERSNKIRPVRIRRTMDQASSVWESLEEPMGTGSKITSTEERQESISYMKQNEKWYKK